MLQTALVYAVATIQYTVNTRGNPGRLIAIVLLHSLRGRMLLWSGLLG